MSSAAYLTFEDGEGPELDAWEPFAAEHGLSFDPHVVGRNTYKGRGVEVSFGKSDFSEPPLLPSGRIDFDNIRPPKDAGEITFSTFWMGEARPAVAKLAITAWHEFGGSLAADPEIKQLIKAG